MGVWQSLKDAFYDNIRGLFFSDVFLCFNYDHDIFMSRAERLKWKKTREVVDKIYPVKNGLVTIRALKDASDFFTTYPFTYLCGMPKSTEQGMCKKTDLERHLPPETTYKDLIILEIDGYCFFITKRALEQEVNTFNSDLREFDYLFSPFLLMYSFIKPMLEDNIVIYATLEHARFFVMVSNQKEICYSKYYHFETYVKLGLQMQQEDKEAYEREEYKLQSFLKSIEANLMNMDFGQPVSTKEQPSDDPETLVDNMLHVNSIVQFLQESIKAVYDDPSCRVNDFIEKVVILNTYEISHQLIETLAEEIMLDVVNIPMSLTERMSILAKKEQYRETEL
ncbi:hypothetical protein [Helicobacter suis]|uniref:hypothetical protein n=1 Tax=Helicobacter suis TaxID=104628 RepID=UPI00249249F9|nr:hypothetical protein [Helicobacter suis]